MDNNIEDFYNSIPWRVKEDAKFPTNFSSMNPEQRRLVKTIYEYERSALDRQDSLKDMSYDAEIIAKEAKTMAEEMAELCESLKKVTNWV